ncbi:MAG: hypothetical protein AABX33_06330 [Nanoarchaeota archaeon]
MPIKKILYFINVKIAPGRFELPSEPFYCFFPNNQRALCYGYPNASFRVFDRYIPQNNIS